MEEAMGDEILSEIFERRLSLDNAGGRSQESVQPVQWDVAMSLWQSMSDRLDEIATNTRNLHLARTKAPSTITRQTRKAEATKEDAANVQRTHARKGKGQAQQREQVTTATGNAPVNVLRSTQRNNESKADTRKGNAPATVAREAVSGAVQPVQQAKPKEQEKDAPAKSTSAESLEKHREEQAAKEQNKGIAQLLKDNLKNWDGSLMDLTGGNAEEAAGLAVGGPVYAALKEFSQAIGDKTDDENSLVGAFRKTLEDKTGITAAKAKVESVKDSVKDRLFEWAGAEKRVEKKKSEKGKRDSKGRFIRTDPTTKEQLELTEKSVSLAESEAKEEEKRHKELIRAVRSVDGGGGIADALGGALGRRGVRVRGAGRAGKAVGKAGRFAKLKSGLGKLVRAGGKVAIGAGGLGTGLLASGAGGAVLDAVSGLGASAALAPTVPATPATVPPVNTAEEAATKKATSKIEEAATKNASTKIEEAAGKKATTKAEEIAGKKAASTAVAKAGSGVAEKGAIKGAGKLGAKAFANAAKVVPVVGQVIAAGMAIADGVSGWNDSEMHKEAFGLEDGQEASTGQKAASAMANVLDMGGLLTGGASLLGIDVNTADIAKGIFSIFGGDTEKEEEASKKADESAENNMPAAIAWEADDETTGLFESLSASLTDLKDSIEGSIEADTAEGNILPQVTGLFSGITSWFSRGGGGKGSSGKAKEIPGAREQAENISGQGLGALSAKYESGKRGSSAIGYDSTGGTSYGKYQIAAKTGTMNRFLEWAEKNGGEEGREVAERMRSAGPLDTGGRGGRAVEEWQALAAEGKLGNLEHDFIKATHFDPAFAGIENEGLRKKIEGSKALQDVLWSTSVQHGAGGAQKIINRAYKEGMSDEEFIRAVYAERGTKFSSSTPQVQAAVRNRFANEAEVAVAMLDKERNAPTMQAEPFTEPQGAESKSDVSTTATKGSEPAKVEGVVAETSEKPAGTVQETATASVVPAAVPVARGIEAAPKAEPIVVESVGQIAPPTEREQKPAMETSSMEKILKDILHAIQGGDLQKNTPGESNGSPSIGMDFDDVSARELANA